MRKIRFTKNNKEQAVMTDVGNGRFELTVHGERFDTVPYWDTRELVETWRSEGYVATYTTK